MSLPGKDTDNGDLLVNFLRITLLNKEFKQLTQMLAKRLALAVGSLVEDSLDQLKQFDKVNHRYMEAVLRVAGFEPVFRS